MFLSIFPSNNLVLEGAHGSNAYLSSEMDVPIEIEQPKTSTGIPTEPNKAWTLVVSLQKSCDPGGYRVAYGARQAGKIWRALIDSDLQSWRFVSSKLDQRLYFKREGHCLIMPLFVVDGMYFASNSRALIIDFKQQLQNTIDSKLYAELQ